MLRNFRQVFKTNQTPMAVIMLVAALSMVAYLAPTGGGQAAPDNVLARVYGRDVLLGDLNDQVTAQINQIRQRNRGISIEALLPRLRAELLPRLVATRLREEQAERHGVIVPLSEVRASLVGQFKRNPLFLDEKGNLLNAEGISQVLANEPFETSLQAVQGQVTSQLIMLKLDAQAAARVPVDAAWVEREHRVRDEKLSFDFVTVSPDPSPVQDPGDPKLQAFLKESGARFQEGPQRVLAYVTLDKAALGLAPVDEAKLRERYESRKDTYKEMKASHILFSAKSEEAYSAALQKAKDTLAKLKAGADFGKLADELTEDSSGKGHQGDLGWFTGARMVKPFSEAASALKVGGLSEPVKTQFGYHIIRLDGRREKTFDDVKDELRAQMENEAFALKGKEKMETLRKRAGERGDLAAPARALGLKVQTSKGFVNGDAVPGLPGSEEIAAEAFQSKVGQVSKVRQAGASFVVFRVQEERPVAVPPLADIRAKVLQAWKQEEARRALQAKAVQAAGDLKALGTPEAKEGVTIASLAELGQHPAIRKALLDTPAGAATAPLWTPDGKLWMARIKERTAAPALTFEARRRIVKDLQAKVADLLLEAELRDLYEEGRKHPGFSSLYGRFGGIYQDEELFKRIQGDAAAASDAE